MWRGVKDIPTVVCTCFLKDFFMFLVETSVYKNTKSTKRKRTPLNSVLNVWCDATMMVGAFLSYCIVYKIHWLRLFFFKRKNFFGHTFYNTSTQMMWKRLVSFLGWGKPEYACLEWNLCLSSQIGANTQKVHKHWGVFFGKVIKTDKKTIFIHEFYYFLCVFVCMRTKNKNDLFFGV